MCLTDRISSSRARIFNDVSLIQKTRLTFPSRSDYEDFITPKRVWMFLTCEDIPFCYSWEIMNALDLWGHFILWVIIFKFSSKTTSWWDSLITDSTSLKTFSGRQPTRHAKPFDKTLIAPTKPRFSQRLHCNQSWPSPNARQSMINHSLAYLNV